MPLTHSCYGFAPLSPAPHPRVAAGPQVVLSFVVFPKPLSWKYVAGGLIVAAALYGLQRTGKKPPPAPGLGPLPDLAPLASLGGGGGGGVDGDREHARGGGGMGAVG